MRATTLEKLLKYRDDKELLDIYTELESGKIPSTSYVHDFCRKINDMVDKGELCVGEGQYRHIYLPTLRKAVYKEMANRYAAYMYNYKAPQPATLESELDDDEDDIRNCEWCNLEFEADQLIPTDLGMLCSRCIDAIRSRGDIVCILR